MIARRTSRWRSRIALFVVLALSAQLRGSEIKGVPYTRQYSFDDIGAISSGVELSVDFAGRIGLAQNGQYIVLNDESWLTAVSRDAAGTLVRHVTTDETGSSFYCSSGSWGLLTRAQHELLEPVPFMPEDRPLWTTRANFDRIVPCREGVAFGSTSGVVFWNRITNQTVFAHIKELTDVFYHSGNVYVSGYDIGTRILDLKTGDLVLPESPEIATALITHSADLNGEVTVFANDDDELFRYEVGTVSRLPFPDRHSLGGHVTTLLPLGSDRFAAAVVGQGIYIISSDGTILTHLSGIEFQHTTSFASNEPGVLWAVTESSVLKIIYGAPVTRVGQALGLPIGWPQLVVWNDRVFAASDGRIYVSNETASGEPVQFHAIGDEASGEGWGLATWNDWLVVGNRDGIFARCGEGEFEKVLSDFDAARIEFMDSGVLFAVGAKEIAALTWNGSEWAECAPRAPGVGYPTISHAAAESVWIELGANLAARLSVDAGNIVVRTFDSFPWSDPRWVHVNVLGDLVILNGPEGGRVYFDESEQSLVDRPDMETLLQRADGFWPARIFKDSEGTYWMSHAHGVTLLRTDGVRYELDDKYRIIDEYIPRMYPLARGVVALSTGRSLFLLDQSKPILDYSRFKPLVVSASDSRTGEELLENNLFSNELRLPFEKNSLTLRLFSGSYGLRRRPVYEYRTNETNWSRLDGSLLALSNLPDGDYRLEVRLIDAQGPLGEPLKLRFSVAPPWIRTLPVLIGLIVLIVGFLILGAKLLMRRAKRRHVELELLVHERTGQLEETLDKLEQETRTSATLAERNRLAGEIHDTLEQGFSALVLQLDTTSKLSECPAKVQTGLAIARNMVAFSRDEVRDAVWGLHSPRLSEGGLVAAIERLLEQTAPQSIEASLSIEGEPRRLPSKVEHHLLRIVQEAVANAVKHGAPQRIEARLEYGEMEIRLTVSDDGVGFDPESVASVSHGRFGLQYLRTRSSKIGAHLELDSQIGKGTRIVVVVTVATV